MCGEHPSPDPDIVGEGRGVVCSYPAMQQQPSPVSAMWGEEDTVGTWSINVGAVQAQRSYAPMAQPSPYLAAIEGEERRHPGPNPCVWQWNGLACPQSSCRVGQWEEASQA